MHEVLHPKHWKAARGYANGIAAEGRMVFTGGIIGWNADQVFETDDFVGQVKQALKSIVEVLACAGARPEHLVRLTWYVTDKKEYLGSLKELGRAYRATIYVQDPALDARSLRIAMETRGGGAVAPETLRAVEDAILTRARQLRIQDTKL